MSRQGALYPPISFSMVEEGIYRSGLPTELNFGFLKSLNLKMVVLFTLIHLLNHIYKISLNLLIIIPL